MFQFSISTNPNLILEALRSENNRRWAWIDGSEPKSFSLPPHMLFVEVWNTNLYYGCFCLEQIGSVAEVHTCLLPISYGKAIQIGKEFIQWLRQFPSIKKLVTMCGEDNELIKRLTLRCGFVLTGKSSKTWKYGDHIVKLDSYELKLGGL